MSLLTAWKELWISFWQNNMFQKEKTYVSFSLNGEIKQSAIQSKFQYNSYTKMLKWRCFRLNSCCHGCVVEVLLNKPKSAALLLNIAQFICLLNEKGARFCVSSNKYHVSCLINKVCRTNWLNKQKRQAFCLISLFKKHFDSLETIWLLFLPPSAYNLSGGKRKLK